MNRCPTVQDVGRKVAPSITGSFFGPFVGGGFQEFNDGGGSVVGLGAINGGLTAAVEQEDGRGCGLEEG
eukprot:scaffold5287_cov59-Attheya_sp.AAC.2